MHHKVNAYKLNTGHTNPSQGEPSDRIASTSHRRTDDLSQDKTNWLRHTRLQVTVHYFAGCIALHLRRYIGRMCPASRGALLRVERGRRGKLTWRAWVKTVSPWVKTVSP